MRNISIRESFWDARRSPLIFFAVAYFFGVSVNLASSLEFVARHKWWILLGVPAVIVIVILSPLFPQVWPRRRAEPVSTIQPARKYRGLVVFASVGAGIETAIAAIRYQNPEFVWCFHSDKSQNDAFKLKESFLREGLLTDEKLRLLRLTDEEFDNPGTVREAIENSVFSVLPEGMTERDVIIDMTGGLKTTTAGAFLAGLSPDRNIEIMKPASTDERGRGQVAGQPLEISISYRLKRVWPR
ncbi:MAG: hypothetical protein FJ280_23000 [Planctomycetes bacterium]|nr:hypothetical protein [Planctomycetota bacterium]